MDKLVRRVASWATFGLLLGARSVQASLNGSYVWVTNTSEVSPLWVVTSNSEFTSMVGTYFPSESSAATSGTYCSSVFFNTSATWGAVALKSKPNCTVRFDEVNVVLAQADIVFYLSIPRGPACVDDGALTITRVNCSAALNAPQVVTLNAPGFLPVDSAHFKLGNQHGKLGNNYYISGRNDLVITQYRPGEKAFTVARAAIDFGNSSNQPALINLTTVMYDLQLRQLPLSYAQTTIDLRNQTHGWIYWYYSPPLLLVAAVSGNTKQLMLTWYNAGQLGAKTVIESPNSFFYGIDLYPYNQTAFVLSSTMLTRSSSLLRHLYLLNVDGTVRKLTDSIPSELTDLVVLHNDLAQFKRGGILGLLEGNTLNSPKLLYLDPNAGSELYELPMHTSWWDYFGITESADAIHLEEAKNLAGVTQLGTWSFSRPDDPTTANRMSTAVNSTSVSLPQTKQTSFFWNKTTQIPPESNTNLILLAGGCSLLFLGLATSLACCLRWLYIRNSSVDNGEEYIPLENRHL